MLRNTPDMKVRLSAPLREQIEQASRNNNRTMNAEIVARLEQSFRDEIHVSSPIPVRDRDDRLEKLESAVISLLVDSRLVTLSERVAALEKGLSERLA
jgi:hypothetical protein